MDNVDRWLLPDGVEEVLPPQASVFERVRRQLLDHFQSWGYELVIPPMVEFLDSLLTGTGSDLDLKTFKLTDQISGRMMGIRADITPQVARIDAHSLNREGHVRLCYAGTVLHAKADHMLASRTPISVGAELFGSKAARGDLEIVSLMVDSLQTVTGETLHVELGDVGIFRELLDQAKLSERQESHLFDLIQGKALPDLAEMVSQLSLDQAIADALMVLPELCGTVSVLEEGRQYFSDFPGVLERLDNLEGIAKAISARHPQIHINYDLSELRGYNYHTGIVFAAYLKRNGQRLAKGGRYDDVGEVFGRARGATGFDIDLRVLVGNLDTNGVTRQVVVVPTESSNQPGCWEKMRELRAARHIVIEGEVPDFDTSLRFEDGEWRLIPAANS